jgi:hypothetical protein
MSGVVFLLIMFVVLAGVMYLIVRTVYEQQRREHLQAIADRMGFAYSAEAEPGLWNRVSGFSLCSKGFRRTVHNAMHRRIHDIDVTLFDYRYTTSSGRHHQTHYRTVVLFETDRLRLPRFTLCPQHFFHRIASALGSQDINFEAHPLFSESYRLQGPDEKRIRRLFDEGALLYFTRHTDLHAEGDGRRLIVYRGGSRVDPQQMEAFLQQGLDVLDAFMEKESALGGVALLGMEVEEQMDELLAVEWLE